MSSGAPLLSQENFPRLFKVFQWTIGGTIDKRKLAVREYRGQKHVLEIGCSIGNIAQAFIPFRDIQYTGLDIDAGAIAQARRDFRRLPNFTFLSEDLNVFAKESQKRFSYILFSAVAHHIDDSLLSVMLSSAGKLLAADGTLMVIDPVRPTAADNRFIHNYQKMERGQFVRPYDELKRLIVQVPELKLIEEEQTVIGATPLSLPPACRFGIFKTVRA